MWKGELSKEQKTRSRLKKIPMMERRPMASPSFKMIINFGSFIFSWSSYVLFAS